jgi:hypothetical protein
MANKLSQSPKRQLKTNASYALFVQNSTELLHQFFPGEFDCTHSSFDGTKIQLPLACQWKGKNKAEKNTAEEFISAKRIITYAWWRELKKKEEMKTTLACDLGKWAERAIYPKGDYLTENGRLFAVVAVVKRLSFLGKYNPFQHLTIFFYREKKYKKVCSIGVNMRSSIEMMTGGSNMHINSPDEELYNIENMDIVAVFPVEKKRAFILSTAISHIEKELTFHNFSESEFEKGWENHMETILRTENGPHLQKNED